MSKPTKKELDELLRREGIDGRGVRRALEMFYVSHRLDISSSPDHKQIARTYRELGREDLAARIDPYILRGEPEVPFFFRVIIDRHIGLGPINFVRENLARSYFEGLTAGNQDRYGRLGQCEEIITGDTVELYKIDKNKIGPDRGTLLEQRVI